MLLYDFFYQERRREKESYFESTLGHFGVFVVELHPLLDDAADAGLRVVDELEAGDVRPAFPQICQIDVQETLRQEVGRQTGEPRHSR